MNDNIQSSQSATTTTATTTTVTAETPSPVTTTTRTVSPIVHPTTPVAVNIPVNNSGMTSTQSILKSSVIHLTTKVINSTQTLRNTNTKFSLPIMLGSIFGGLAVIVLIASIITYILIKKGHIKVFNQPRTYLKNGKLIRIPDSSSSIGDASPSRR